MVKFYKSKMKLDGRWVDVWVNKRLKRDWLKLIEGSNRQSNRRKGKNRAENELDPDLEAPENNEDDVVEVDGDEF